MDNIDPAALVLAITQRSPSFQADGRRFYIVERDFQLEESELLAYATALLSTAPPSRATGSPAELVGATVNGKLIRWQSDTSLTWRIDRATFPGSELADRAHEYQKTAAEDWNGVAAERKLNIRFEEAAEDSDPVFRVTYQYLGNPNLLAVAFFPNDPAFKRFVRIAPLTFAQSEFHPAGILRHELGHVLGFRHEHIRPEAPEQIESWVSGELGAETLGGYDSKSLMHYPMQGVGSVDFSITAFDKEGFEDLYTKEDVIEFRP